MSNHTSLACTTCNNKTHCQDCRVYLSSPVAFKAAPSTTRQAAKNTYKKSAILSTAAPVETHTICSSCESKMCFACSMYNTHFIKEA